MKNLKTYKLFENKFHDPELFKIIKYGNYNELKNFLENEDYDIDHIHNHSTPLIRATFNLRNDMVELLLDYGADPNVLTSSNISALLYAGFDNNIDVVKLLIDAGADWEISDEGKIFLDHLIPENEEIIKNLYPEKYKEAMAKIKSNDFNI